MNAKPDRDLRIELKRRMEACDVDAMRQIISEHPEFLKNTYWSAGSILHSAASKNSVEMVRTLVEEFGIDVNIRYGSVGPIFCAATHGATDVARWLLEHGAKVDPTSFMSAILEGNLELVQILVKHGADINDASGDPPITPLGYAIMYGQQEIENYLRSLEAKDAPDGMAKPEAPSVRDTILKHIEKHLGKVKPLALQGILADEPPISIHIVPADKRKKRDHITIVTTSMSDRAMNVPAESEGLETAAYRHAELVMQLPADWPLTDKALGDPQYSWPFEWLRKLARYPLEHNTWLGVATIVANEEPPEPLAPNTELTCILALTGHDEFSVLRLEDGRTVLFYYLFPIYTEERDLEKKKGVEHLLAMFEKHKIGKVVDIDRKNVAVKGK